MERTSEVNLKITTPQTKIENPSYTYVFKLVAIVFI